MHLCTRCLPLCFQTPRNWKR
uniref:Uncharacterized protein n=1 Tax=Anguilla anguilla TaxID=7936 RepID=A0A0E9XQU1_ANGAN